MSRATLLCALALAFTAPGCATVVGTAAGPVTGPLHLQENMHGVDPWFYPVAYPISVPFGVLAGFCVGAAADVGWVLSGGGYGAPGHPHFGSVFNPMSPDWGRYRPERILAEQGYGEPASR